MIEPKEAVIRASEAVKNLYADENISSPELEEVELSDDEKYWLVTLRFNIRNPESSSPALVALIGGKNIPYSKMKRILIDRDNGEFRGMRIRQPDVN